MKKKKALRNLSWSSKSWPVPKVNPTGTKGRDRSQRKKSHTNIPTTLAHCRDFLKSSASGDNTVTAPPSQAGEEKGGCRHEGEHLTFNKAPKGWEWEAGVALSPCKLRSPPWSWQQLTGHTHQEEGGSGREVRNNPCSCVESCWLG